MLEQSVEEDGVWVRLLPVIKEFASARRFEEYQSNASELIQSYTQFYLGLRSSGMEWLEINKRYLNLTVILTTSDTDIVQKIRILQLILKANIRYGPNQQVFYLHYLDECTDADLVLDVRLDLYFVDTAELSNIN